MVITPLIEYVALFHLVEVNIIFNSNYQASSLSLLLLAATGSTRHIHRLFVPFFFGNYSFHLNFI